MQNKIKNIIVVILIIFSMTAQAITLGGYCGRIDTEALGEASVVGGSLAFDTIPFVDLYFGGAYVSSFDVFKESRPLGKLIRYCEYEVDDLYLVPLETGVLVEISLLDIIELYCGAGVVVYLHPNFSLSYSYEKEQLEKEVDISNMFGWWGKAGIAVGIPHLKIFAEAKYTSLDTHKVDIDIETAFLGDIHETVEIDMSNVQVLVGARLEF